MLSRRCPTGAAVWSGNAKPLTTMQLAEPVAAHALALSSPALGSVGAQAQAAGAVGPQAEQSLEEIVVAATRGEKPLIEVPASVPTQQTEEPLRVQSCKYYFSLGGSRTMSTHVTPGVPGLARATLRWRF